MELSAKKTFELTEKDYSDIVELLCEVFDFDYTVEGLKAFYTGTSLGYSFHSILHDGDKLVGYEAYIPFYYLKGEEKFLATLGVNTVTAPTHRDFSNYYDVYQNGMKMLKENQVKLRFGFPNDNSCPLLVKGFKHKLIGHLQTYVLPIRVGGFKSSLRLLNPASHLFSAMLLLLSRLQHGSHGFSFKYKKDIATFDNRYNWYGGGYHKVEIKNGYFVYKNRDYEGAKAAFLLDVQPMTKRGFNEAIRYIYHHEKNNVDFILFVGRLPFKPFSLVRIPLKYAPKHFNFSCKVLDSKFFDDSLYNIDNWEVSLANYDLV